MVVLFKKRPQPKFEPGRLALVPPEPHTRVKKARYLLITKRRWVTTDKEWVYTGALFMIDHDVLVFKHEVQDLSEERLRPMRGGNWE